MKVKLSAWYRIFGIYPKYLIFNNFKEGEIRLGIFTDVINSLKIITINTFNTWIPKYNFKIYLTNNIMNRVLITSLR